MTQDMILFWSISLITAIIVAILIRKFLFFPIVITSNSMEPTIKQNGKYLISCIYRYKKISRGDILLFYSNELNMMVVKRVAGLPRDIVRITKDGKIHYNDEVLDNFTEFHVPEKKFMFIGDNKEISYDSRKWEEPYIDEQDIKGKVIFRLWPLYYK